MIVLGFTDYAVQSQRLATALGARHAWVTTHAFPDGETKLVVPAPLPERVIVCRSLDHPNDKLVELLLCARTARDLGARDLTLVAPYLCYMRQDIAFTPGESVSQRIVGEFLASLFDTVITVDPHLHRVSSLKEAVPAKQAITLTAAALIGSFLRDQLTDALLVGPDVESEQWVASAARNAGCDYVVARKQRLGDHDVRVTLPAARYAGRDAVIVDDMASTGRTVAETAKALTQHGARAVHVAVTHGLFNAGALDLLKKSGVRNMWTTDSIGSAAGGMPLAELLANAIQKTHPA